MVKTSITQKNTNIDKLSVILQKARIHLVNENLNMRFSDDITRKIVLILCVHYIAIKKDDITTLLDIIRDFKENLWIDQFLGATYEYNKAIISDTYKKVSEISEIVEWQELIYYAYETFEYSPEQFLQMPMKRGIHIALEKKKKQGIYYTPSDIIDFMVGYCIKTNNSVIPVNEQTYLDCSCGTSVFLLNVMRKQMEKNPQICNASDMMGFIDCAIWGIDISEIAIDNCKIVFMTEFLLRFSSEEYSMNLLWNIIANSFCCGDATDMEIVLKNNVNFPRKYSCVVGNPPYVTLPGKGNLFISFVNNMMKYSDESSCSSLIVPLSLCFSQAPAFITLRQKIIDDKKATWYFYNFDRSPDSLFGDQVKTRNTIIFRNQGNCKRKILSTNLQRWTSENREGLFERIKMVDIEEYITRDYIPKISTDIEKIVLAKCIAKEKSVFDMLLIEDNQSANLLAVNGTAYNWICAYDHIPPSRDEKGKLYIPNSMQLYFCKSKTDLYFVIGILCNRITYWYWTVVGDGFHLNSLFMKKIGIYKEQFSKSAYEKIAILGEKYCKEIRKYVQVSYNSKKQIVNYDYLPLLDEVSQVEKIMATELGIPNEFNSYIEEWYNQHVFCNRNDRRR